MSTSYDASSIEILSGLDPVRKRPGMYTDTASPDHLAQEVIDNSVDEALAGHAGLIEVTLHNDDSMSVRDDGRGMPVDRHPQRKCSGVEVILTTLHSGGKFSDRHYRYAGGLHGVGVSVVNGLSKHLEIWIKRDGKEYNMAFADGAATSALEEVGKVSKRNTGSTIRFWPDPGFFDKAQFNVKHLQRLLCTKAVLCSGLRITFENEADGKKNQWCYRDGISEYFRELTDGQPLLLNQSIYDSHTGKDHELAWCLNWSDEDAAPLAESYVNLVPTPQGGSHVAGLRAGIVEAVREFMEFHELTMKNVKPTPEDFWSNVCYLVSLKIENPQFAGQIKERLTHKSAASIVQSVTKDALSLWLNRHPREGERIVELVLANAQKRRRKSAKQPRKSLLLNLALPGKLADCSSRDLDANELFLVEGDSAGGSVRQARARQFQAVMPLRGKIMNTWETKTEDILESREIHDISTAIGVKPGDEDLDGLRYGKICILADADADGLHIATLLAALFVRHFPQLVITGHVYVAVPPLFRIDVGKRVHYANNEQERDRYLDGLSQKDAARARVTRFKGLGEMNPQQLKESTMTVDNRHLLQLVYEPGSAAQDTMDMLLAKKRASDRRVWLNDKGNLAQTWHESGMTQRFSQNIIAVIWDFDKTLIPGHMQAPLFTEYKVEEKAFWDEVNELPQAYKVRGCDQISNEMLYLSHILTYVRNGTFKGLNNKKLRSLGKRLEFYKGLPTFFDELRQSLQSGPYQKHDIKLEHYVVSTGLRQMILGSELNGHFDGVWGCELLDEEDDGELSSIGYVLDHTTKTRAIFEINKGVNVEPSIDVNARMEESERRVPISQMIYIADGPSDVPVFSVVKRRGGRTYAVHNPDSRQAYDQAYDLLHKEQRVDAMGAADYSRDSATWRWLMRTVKDIADGIVVRGQNQLHDSVGTPPGHLSD